MGEYIEVFEQPNDKTKIVEKLLDEYGRDIKRLAFLYVKDHALAEDILQEVMIACFKNIGTFRHESSYKTWLLKITINKCKDLLRKWSFKNIVYKKNVDYQTVDEITPETKTMVSFDEQHLIKEVMLLPIKFREVIILFYYQELSLEEISLIMNTNVNTVKTRLHRAKKRIKESMKGREEEWNDN